MGHVRCDYQKFYCSNNDVMATGDCLSCKVEENYYDYSGCVYLELRPAHIDKTSKSIEFDGETLFVGGRYIASILPVDDACPTVDDTYINSLEIDGEVYVKDGEIVKE